MLARFLCVLSLSIAASLSWAPVATAAPINYGDFLGVNPGEPDFLQVTEDSITDLPPLFGAPTHVADKLMFFPTMFAASASNGAFDSAAGTLTMHIKADVGYYLDLIDLSEIGDCTLLGIGYASADVYGLLGVTDVTPGTHGSLGTLLAVDPAPPYWSPSFTPFTGGAQIDLSGLNITEVALAFNDTLEAYSSMGTSAFIQKKAFAIEVTSVPVPEPASGLLLLMGGFALLTRRLGS